MPEYVAVSKVMVCGALLLFACAGPGSYVRNEIGEREALKAAERRAAGAAQLAAIERTIQEEKESLQRAQQEEDTIVQRNGVTGPSVHETFDAIDDMRRDDTMLTAITHELPCAMRIGDATVRLDRLRYGSIEQLEYVSSNLIGTIYTMSVADELGGRAKIKLESPAVAQRLKRAFAHLGELCGAPSRPFDAESLPLREIPRSSWRRTDEYFG